MTAADAPARTAADLLVVDMDSHTGPFGSNFLEYLDESDVATQMLRRADHVNSQILTKTRASAPFPNDPSEPDAIARGGSGTVEGKRRYMDEFDIDYSVLTPGSAAMATINHDQTAVSLMRAGNDYVIDQWVDADPRLLPVALTVNHRPDLAAEEIDRMAGHGVVAVQFPAAGLVPPAGHRSYDPIYQAAQDHGLTINLHSADEQAAMTFPVQFRWAETFTECHAFSFPAESMWHLISMICSGVPERFPDLQFVVQEPGFEWLPWMIWRLDDHYLQCSDDLPMLTKRPSAYIRDQWYFTTQPLGHTEDRAAMASIMEIAGGADTIVYSSDHPHPDFDPPSEVLDHARAGLDPADVRGIMGETAADLYGLA